MENIKCLMERLRNSAFGAKTLIINNACVGGGGDDNEEVTPVPPDTGLSEDEIKCKMEELKKCKSI